MREANREGKKTDRTQRGGAMPRHKVLAAILAVAIFALGSLVGCAGGGGSAGSNEQGAPAQESGAAGAESAHQPVAITPSPDKYTWYVKDYVGTNVAAIGYTSLDGFRRDSYGAGTVKLILVAADGTYLDPENEDQLKGYVVKGQNLAPNTELKYTFMTDSEGEEYDNLIAVQSYEEIVLSVAPVGDASPAPELTVIESAPDKYTRYVKDYVGRNLASCGYVSLAGKLTDAYGAGYITFDITASDGSFVDVEDETSLQNYIVRGQSVAPNTAVTMTFMLDGDGNEYDNLVDTSSVDSINLTVEKIA